MTKRIAGIAWSAVIRQKRQAVGSKLFARNGGREEVFDSMSKTVDDSVLKSL